MINDLIKNTQPITIIEGKEHIDFSTIEHILDYSKSHTHRILEKHDVKPNIFYNNKYYYLIDSITPLIQSQKNIKENE